MVVLIFPVLILIVRCFLFFFNDSDDLMAVQIVGLKITDIYFGAVGHIQSTRSFGMKFCYLLRC